MTSSITMDGKPDALKRPPDVAETLTAVEGAHNGPWRSRGMLPGTDVVELDLEGPDALICTATRARDAAHIVRTSPPRIASVDAHMSKLEAALAESRAEVERLREGMLKISTQVILSTQHTEDAARFMWNASREVDRALLAAHDKAAKGEAP